MTTLTDTQVITASGGLVELGYQSTDRTNVAVSATTSSGATELVSTTVVCDGGPILIEFQCCIACATGEGVAFRVWIDGVDTAGFAGNTNSQTNRETYFQTVRLQPAAGSRTISIRWYRWTGSTVLTSLTGNAILRVSKIVQATQWPAVTTGTIICTSSTRPASPFEGQKIYETDTKKELTYNGSGWYAFNQVVGSHSLASTQGTSATHTTFQDEGLTLGSISYPANRRWKVSLSVRPYPNGGLQAMLYQVVLGSTVMERWIFENQVLNASTAGHQSLVGYFNTPSTAGTDTLKVQFRAASNNTQVTSWASALSQEGGRRLIVEDIGPA